MNYRAQIEAQQIICGYFRVPVSVVDANPSGFGGVAYSAWTVYPILTEGWGSDA